MIKGKEIDLGGTVYTVPPLNLESIELFQDKIVNYTGGLDPESLKLVAEVTLHALRRNYPDMTIEKVKQILDLGNMAEVFRAVLLVSGFEERSDMPGEAQAPGQ